MKKVIVNESQFNRLIIGNDTVMMNEAVDEGWFNNTDMAGIIGIETIKYDKS